VHAHKELCAELNRISMRCESSAWVEVTAENGKVYYWNAALNQSSWTKPDEWDDAAADAAPAAAPTAAGGALEALEFVKHIDPGTGQPYWHNTATDETTWYNPRGAVSASVLDIVAVPVTLVDEEGSMSSDGEERVLIEPSQVQGPRRVGSMLSMARSAGGSGDTSATLGEALSTVERVLLRSASATVPLSFCLLAARAANPDELRALERTDEGRVVGQYIRALSATDRSLVTARPQRKQNRRLSTVDSLALISFLKSISLFQRLPEHQLVALTAKFRVRTYADGEAIIEEGDNGTTFFVVRKGNVGIYKRESGDKRVYTHTAGGFFGEVALLQEVQRTASCVADGEVECLAVDKEDFLVSLSGMSDLMGAHYVDYSKSNGNGLVSLSEHIDMFVSVLSAFAEKTTESTMSMVGLARTTSVLALTAASASGSPLREWHTGAALRIFSAVAPVLEFDAIANKVLQEALTLTRANCIRVTLLKPHAVEAAARGADLGEAPFETDMCTLYAGENPVESSLLARLAAAAVARGVPISVNNVAAEPLCSGAESLAHCALVVPLFIDLAVRGALVKRKVIGVIEATDKAAGIMKQGGMHRVSSYMRGTSTAETIRERNRAMSARFPSSTVPFTPHDEATLCLLAAAVAPLVRKEDDALRSNSERGYVSSSDIRIPMVFKPTLVSGVGCLLRQLSDVSSTKRKGGAVSSSPRDASSSSGATNAVPGLKKERKTRFSIGSSPDAAKSASAGSSSPRSRRRGSVTAMTDAVKSRFGIFSRKQSISAPIVAVVQGRIESRLGDENVPSAATTSARADASVAVEIAAPSWRSSKRVSMKIDLADPSSARSVLQLGLEASITLFHGDAALTSASVVPLMLPGQDYVHRRGTRLNVGMKISDVPRSACAVVELRWRGDQLAVGRHQIFSYDGKLTETIEIELEPVGGELLEGGNGNSTKRSPAVAGMMEAIDESAADPIILKLSLARDGTANSKTPIVFRYYAKEAQSTDPAAPSLPSRALKKGISRKLSQHSIAESSPRAGVQRDVDMRRTLSKKQMIDGADSAVLELVQRINGLHMPTAEERATLWKNRLVLSYHTTALPAVMLSVAWNSLEAAQEAHVLLERWDNSNAHIALQLLDRRFPDPAVRTFAVHGLQRLSDDELLVYLLQLTQTLRFEPYCDSSLSRFLLRRALANTEVIGHVLYWSLKAEMCDKLYSQYYSQLLEQYIIHCGGHRVKLGLQNFVVQKLKAAQEKVKDVASLTSAKEQLREELATIVFPQNVQLPLSPHLRISGLNIDGCSVMDSKMRPLMLSFKRGTDGDRAPSSVPLRVLFKVSCYQLRVSAHRMLDRARARAHPPRFRSTAPHSPL
jgi:CRP-like cAMP-binding protein